MAPHADRTEIDQQVCTLLPDAMRFALKLTNDHDFAEELLQDSLLKVSKNWKSFKQESSFKTWFYRVMINTFRDHLKKSRPVLLKDSGSVAGNSAEPLTGMIHEEMSALISQKIKSLPYKQREVLLLSAYENFSIREISETLTISEKNVYSTLHIARTRLKEMLKEYLTEKE